VSYPNFLFVKEYKKLLRAINAIKFENKKEKIKKIWKVGFLYYKKHKLINIGYKMRHIGWIIKCEIQNSKISMVSNLREKKRFRGFN